MTGVELLLARAQLWQTTAAQHVSLQEQLHPLSALAARWRRLELHAWHGLLDDARARHAAGACQSEADCLQLGPVCHLPCGLPSSCVRLWLIVADSSWAMTNQGWHGLLEEARIHHAAGAGSGLQLRDDPTRLGCLRSHACSSQIAGMQVQGC